MAGRTNKQRAVPRKPTVIKKKPTPPVAQQPKINNSPIQFVLNDPAVSSLVLNVMPPAKPELEMNITGYAGGGFQWGTAQAQAAECYVALTNSLNYVLPRMKRKPARWAGVQSLNVVPRAGRDFNAFYDRRSLRFFYDKNPSSGKMVYTSESPDVITHELGHALLDIMRPDFWNTASLEAFAFHEAFGDCNAVLHTMQYDPVLDYALTQDLMKPNAISGLAEELGIALTGQPLRDAANSFVWTKPERLPKNSPDDRLSQECHNFSRVWTGAWYEMMVRIFEKNKKLGMAPKAALQRARDVAANYLLLAIPAIPNTVRVYEALARQMLIVDQANNGLYQDAMNGVFKDRKIISEGVSMLSVHDKKSLMLKQDGEVWRKEETDHNGTALRIKRKSCIKLEKHLGIGALADNPLYGLEIEVPSEEGFFFDKSGQCIHQAGASEKEVLESAEACLQYLHIQNLVGPDASTPFEVVDGKLVRSHFACDCRFDNSTDPRAPEYGKGWKAANNAGCGCGKSTPAETSPLPPKLGCYISSKVGGIVTRRYCSSVSRKVC